MAVHDLGLFELDRNAEDANFADLPDDWAALYDNGANTGAHSDDFSGILPDIGGDGGTQFQGGGSKDDLDITSWLWKTGEPLDKDDITNAYAAAYTNTTPTPTSDVGDLIIYFGLDRFSTAGSAQVGFWFLQDESFGLTNTPSGGGFKFSGQHVDGDVLVQSNFTNGGVISNLTVYEWQGGALVEIIDAADCIPGMANDLACATVNQGSTPAPWPYTPKANEGPPGTFQTSAFFEGGINISQLIPDAGCFTAFTGETRSSTPFDSRLKDFVIGNLDTCIRDVSVEKTPDGGSVNAGDPISFTMTVTNESPNSEAENVTLDDDLPDSGFDWSITADDPAGSCTITGSVGSQHLSCNFGTLAIGGSASVTVTSDTDAEDCGLVENTVTVSADGDIDSSNNTDTGDITVNCGALRILKQSTKTGNPLVANPGAVFSYDGSSVTDNGAGDEDPDVGEVCVSGLAAGDYTVNETSPPPGYGGASQSNLTATVVAGTNCTDNLPTGSAVVTFTNPPLADIQVNFRDGGSGETSATIDCEPPAGVDTPDVTPATGWDTSVTHEGLAPGTYVCTVVIDP